MNRRKYLIEQIANLVLERILENQEPFFAKGLKKGDIGILVQKEFQNLFDTLRALQISSVNKKESDVFAEAANVMRDIKEELVNIFLKVSRSTSSANEAVLPLQGAGYIPKGVAIPPKGEGLMDDVDAVNVRSFLTVEFDSIAKFMQQQADMIRDQLRNTKSATEIYKLITELRGVQTELNKYTLEGPNVDRESLKLKSGYLARKADVQYGGKSTPRPGVFAVRSDRYPSK